jgi:hypothetical protein
MITHIIYHIPGRKVGCTKNLKGRLLWYRRYEGKEPEYEVLEELHDKTDQEAGDRERFWADKFGYPRGPHFTSLTFELRSTGGRKGGSISGPKTLIEGLGIHAITQEQNREYSRQGGRRLAELGRSPFQIMTREKRQEIGRKVGHIGGRIGGLASSKIVVVCPHCGIKGTFILYRWHFDNCPKR